MQSNIERQVSRPAGYLAVSPSWRRGAAAEAATAMGKGPRTTERIDNGAIPF